MVGESGSGKTVTALAIMGLIDPPGRDHRGRRPARRPVAGRARRRRVPPDPRAATLAMVFQDPMTALNPVQRVGDQIAEAITVHDASRVAAAPRGARSIELLERVGIAPAAQRARDVPAPALGRHAPAGDARDGAGEPARGCSSPTSRPPRSTSPPRRRSSSCSSTCSARSGLALVLVTHDLGVVAGHRRPRRGDVRGAGRRGGRRSTTSSRRRGIRTRAGCWRRCRRIDGARGGARARSRAAPPNPRRVPPGCAFHPALPAAPRTGAVDAVPRAASCWRAGHRAACHFADEVSIGQRSA